MSKLEWFKMLLGMFFIGAVTGFTILLALGLIERIVEAVK